MNCLNSIPKMATSGLRDQFGGTTHSQGRCSKAGKPWQGMNPFKLSQRRCSVSGAEIVTELVAWPARHALAPILAGLVLCACAPNVKPPEERDPRDPWEPYNRNMFKVNQDIDRVVLRPVAKGYLKVTPEPVQKGVGNFFGNLNMPVVAGNQVMQGKGRLAAETSGRFLMNITWGALGIFDLATKADIPRHDEDFGQTLAVWGWEDSRYFVLPLLGPSTVRDAAGRAVDNYANVPAYELYQATHWSLIALNVVRTRAMFVGQDEEIEQAYDPYVLFRDAYFQRREYQITDGGNDLPDYDTYLDEPDSAD